MERGGYVLEPKTVPNEILKILPGAEPIIKRRRYSVCTPTLIGKEKLYVKDCMETGWISSLGPYVERFQKMFAEKVGCKYAIAVSSGTAALHLALSALGIKAGDEVIVPSFTMIATANAVSYLGAKPVFVDAEPQTWCIDPKKIVEKITKRTKAIIPVHIYGHPCDMIAINKIAGKYNLYVVEDAAEAHGAEYFTEEVGSLGHVAAFSLYANKIITSGEGGIVTTNDEKIYNLCKTLRDFAFSPERHFWHKYLGYNYRMTNLQAAVALAQTENLEKFVTKRRDTAGRYNNFLQDLGIQLPTETIGCKNVYWMYGILLEGHDRDEVRRRLAIAGIETRTFFIPLHLQPIYYNGDRDYPVSEYLMRQGLYLPSGSGLEAKDIQFISKTLRRILCSM